MIRCRSAHGAAWWLRPCSSTPGLTDRPWSIGSTTPPASPCGSSRPRIPEPSAGHRARQQALASQQPFLRSGPSSTQRPDCDRMDGARVHVERLCGSSEPAVRHRCQAMRTSQPHRQLAERRNLGDSSVPVRPNTQPRTRTAGPAEILGTVLCLCGPILSREPEQRAPQKSWGQFCACAAQYSAENQNSGPRTRVSGWPVGR